MRRVGVEGRAIVKSFSYPKSKDDFIEKIETTARKEGVTFSDVVMEGLDDWWKEICLELPQLMGKDIFWNGCWETIEISTST